MKKVLAVLAALILLVTLCACDGDSEDVVFKNGLSTVIHSVYISPSDADEWTDPLNYARLSAGSSIHIDFAKFAGSGVYYDVAAVDENNRNYDIFEIPLTIGDKLELSASGGTALLTVTSADGTVSTYEGYAYDAEEGAG